MFSLKRIARFAIPALTLCIVAPGHAQSQGAARTPAPLQVQVYNADGHSFHVNAVVVSGKSEAVVIDTGFAWSDHNPVAMTFKLR